MTRASDLRRLLWLLRSYTAPYWYLVTLLIVTSYLATAVAALFPLLMAPILDLALGGTSGLGGGDADQKQRIVARMRDVLDRAGKLRIALRVQRDACCVRDV